jgi:hypothetical protein
MNDTQQTSLRESTPAWLWRIAARAIWDARCALGRFRRGAVRCAECAGGGLVAPGSCCPGCGGSGEVDRRDERHG